MTDREPVENTEAHGNISDATPHQDERSTEPGTATSVSGNGSEAPVRKRWRGAIAVFACLALVGASIATISVVRTGANLPVLELIEYGDVGMESAMACGDGAVPVSCLPDALDAARPVLAPGLDVVASERGVWRLTSPERREVVGLARALGITGEVRSALTLEGKTYEVGGLVVAPNGLWSYYALGSETAVTCAAPGVCPVGGSETARELPDAGEVLGTARAVFPDERATLTETSRDPRGVRVEASLTITSDVVLPEWGYVLVATDSSVKSAGGHLGAVREVGEYPTVSASVALERAVFSHIPQMTASRGAAADESSMTESSMSVPRPGDLLIVEVREVWMTLQDVSGAGYVVPAYEYVAESGAMLRAVALAEKYYRLTTASHSTGVVTPPSGSAGVGGFVDGHPGSGVTPGEPVPGSGVPDTGGSAEGSGIPDRVLTGLVGMTEESARTALEQMGYTARVVQRDGEAFMVTDDYSTSRANLVVRDGLVITATRG